jgi:hypothetical protein
LDRWGDDPGWVGLNQRVLGELDDTWVGGWKVIPADMAGSDELIPRHRNFRVGIPAERIVSSTQTMVLKAMKEWQS